VREVDTEMLLKTHFGKVGKKRGEKRKRSKERRKKRREEERRKKKEKRKEEGRRKEERRKEDKTNIFFVFCFRGFLKRVQVFTTRTTRQLLFPRVLMIHHNHES